MSQNEVNKQWEAPADNLATAVSPDKITGYLEVGLNDQGEIVVNHPDLKPDADGVGHIVFSPNQARSLAALLIKHASKAEEDQRRK